jgi:hypothetical protein
MLYEVECFYPQRRFDRLIASAIHKRFR